MNSCHGGHPCPTRNVSCVSDVEQCIQGEGCAGPESRSVITSTGLEHIGGAPKEGENTTYNLADCIHLPSAPCCRFPKCVLLCRHLAELSKKLSVSSGQSAGTFTSSSSVIFVNLSDKWPLEKIFWSFSFTTSSNTPALFIYQKQVSFFFLHCTARSHFCVHHEN